MAVRVELVEFGYELLDIFVAYLFDRIVRAGLMIGGVVTHHLDPFMLGDFFDAHEKVVTRNTDKFHASDGIGIAIKVLGFESIRGMLPHPVIFLRERVIFRKGVGKALPGD